MKTTDLHVGMTVKSTNGLVVKITGVPTPDKNNECFFSGILIESNGEYFYRDSIGKDFKYNWNSHFFFPH